MAKQEKLGDALDADPNAHKELAGVDAVAPHYDGNYVAMPVYLVECKSGLDWVAQQVFEFEIPFLLRKFPEGVKIKDGETGGYQDLAEDAEPFGHVDVPDNALLVYEQMRRKHNTPRYPAVVDEVTGGLDSFAHATGLTLKQRSVKTESRALVKANKPVAKGKPQTKRAKR